MDSLTSLLTLDSLVSLFLLILLQAVLGFDNLLYITLESKQAPQQHQKKVRQWGIGIAVVLRIILLFFIMTVIGKFQNELFAFDFIGIAEGRFNLHALIVLFGGAFIMHTAIKEIWHMMLGELHQGKRREKSAFAVVFWIVLMNLVFSFDSILSAMALSDNFIIMATAIIIGGVLMIWLSDKVADFLQKNRMYEVLGLFILFVVGIMLVTEGAHLAELKLFGNEIHAMSKTTFYFVIGVLVLSDIVQSRYQKKLLKKKTVVEARAEQVSDAYGA